MKTFKIDFPSNIQICSAALLTVVTTVHCIPVIYYIIIVDLHLLSPWHPFPSFWEPPICSLCLWLCLVLFFRVHLYVRSNSICLYLAYFTPNTVTLRQSAHRGIEISSPNFYWIRREHVCGSSWHLVSWSCHLMTIVYKSSSGCWASYEQLRDLNYTSVGGIWTLAHTKAAISWVRLRTAKNKCLLWDGLGNSKAEASAWHESLWLSSHYVFLPNLVCL